MFLTKTIFLTADEAYQKLKHYCSYQERCHKEVENKLYELKLRTAEHGDVISRLIENNYLNEERFAILFAGGKFRMKQWGKRKISYALQLKGISDYCIKKGLKEIPDPDYISVIQKLVKKKMDSLKGQTFSIKKKKTVEYMMAKGFEPTIVVKAIGAPPPKKAKNGSDFNQ